MSPDTLKQEDNVSDIDRDKCDLYYIKWYAENEKQQKLISS